MSRTQSCQMVQSNKLLELLKKKKKAESQNPSLSPRQQLSPPRLGRLKSPKLLDVQKIVSAAVKLKGVSHIRTLNSDRDNYELIITLITQDKQYTLMQHRYIVPIGLDQTTTDLYQKLITKMSVQDPQNYEKIAYFQSYTQNYNVDYYLSLDDKPLSVFSKGRTLKLIPIYYGESKSNSFDDFTLIKCIGVGGFSRVYLVRQKRNGQFFAMKIIDKSFIIKNNKESMINNEKWIMSNLDSQFLTRLHCSFETKYYLVFVMDYCHGGELFFHLRKMGTLSEEVAKQYFGQLCLAIHYLHEQNVIYRDLKPENILLDIDGYIKLSDFGLSKPNISRDKQTYSFCGSPEYMSPEMVSKRGHNQLLDCYSLGAVLYEFIYGYPPYYDQQLQNILNSIQYDKLEFPEHIKISDQLKNLLLNLLTKDQNERLGRMNGIEDVLNHKWLSNFNYTALYKKQLNIQYKPQPLQTNYNVAEFSKGDREFQQKLQDNLYREQKTKFDKEFQNFDFVSDQPKSKREQFVEKIKYASLRSSIRTSIIRNKITTLSLNGNDLCRIRVAPQLSAVGPRFQSVKNSQISQCGSTQSFRNSSSSKRFNTEYDLQKLLKFKQ
ncbi:unnamed protein product (macronuclear) [Paramecium tetraurelia]|uniref:Protein kinase domain-containing protein n=1 Tax=Paramecium tetraurelia TaxID=5888 RepID=A0EIN6_PARTE|nr:uncharacterized protein GSPATT00027506001 [Paramecium tetraurelia]CAK95177.1 unnamed protein product [Paramecium tetraurelia]|eukprot:XP_001462550.1 hypothetical protein (macronuclear) [Paramecium tetraurelia strain d4-2]